MNDDKLNPDGKVKVDVSFDEAIDKMFENRKDTLLENLEKVIKLKGETLSQIKNDYIAKAIKSVLFKIKKDSTLISNIFTVKNPSINFIPNLGNPRFKYQSNLSDEPTLEKVSEIFLKTMDELGIF